MGVLISTALVAAFVAGAYCVSDEKDAATIKQTVIRCAVGFTIGYLVGKRK